MAKRQTSRPSRPLRRTSDPATGGAAPRRDTVMGRTTIEGTPVDGVADGYVIGSADGAESVLEGTDRTGMEDPYVGYELVFDEPDVEQPPAQPEKKKAPAKRRKPAKRTNSLAGYRYHRELDLYYKLTLIHDDPRTGAYDIQASFRAVKRLTPVKVTATLPAPIGPVKRAPARKTATKTGKTAKRTAAKKPKSDKSEAYAARKAAFLRGELPGYVKNKRGRIVNARRSAAQLAPKAPQEQERKSGGGLSGLLGRLLG